MYLFHNNMEIELDAAPSRDLAQPAGPASRLRRARRIGI